MGPLKESVINLITNSSDDDRFIDEFDKIAQANGEKTYQEVLKVLVDFDFEPGQAKNEWIKIVEHRDKISKALDRKICLTAAISDFFSTSKNSLTNQKLVGIDAYEKAIQESTHDKLTGLFNNAYLKKNLDQHLSMAKRYNTELSLLFIDIDDFKEINDTHGHQTGDVILKSIAKTIEKGMRASDIKSRFGGDEFVILMPNTDKINALLLAERLREEIKKSTITTKDNRLQITISGGVAGFPADARDAGSLLDLADSALYRAKGAGKDSISLFKKDKRRFLRIKIKRDIKVKKLGFDGTHTQMGVSKNIAIGGILFENNEPLDIGTKVQVSIPMAKGAAPLLLIGSIVRVEAFGENQYDIGMILSFKEMEKTAKDEISKFLIQRSKTP